VGRVRGLVLILCTAGLLASCGGDDDESTVVETTTVTTIETVPTTTPAEPDEGGPAPADPDTPANGHGGTEAPRRCGRIAFNPSTDSGAASITAVGTDCETARAVARAARNAADELSYEAEGFRCSGTESDNVGLASIEWSCAGAEREVVSFVTT
jgi:hypothetical protein